MENKVDLGEKFSYQKAIKENILCNFCDSDNLRVISNEDSEGFGANTVICRECGLIFISPRMTRKYYDLYYQKEYRSVTLGIEKIEESVFEKLFQETFPHGVALGKFIKDYVKGNGIISEVGSGPGGVLSGVKKVLNREVVGIEPSRGECDHANKKGIKTHCNLFEDFNVSNMKVPQFGAIICTQSLNHLLDPKSFFVWSYGNLSKEGIIVLEAMNFRHQLKKSGAFKNSVQIDHVYMFTPEVLKNFVESAGFDILLFDYDEKKNNLRSLNLKDYKELPGTHIRIVAKKSKRKPFEGIKIEKKNYYLNSLFVNNFYSYFYYILNIRLPKLLNKYFLKK